MKKKYQSPLFEIIRFSSMHLLASSSDDEVIVSDEEGDGMDYSNFFRGGGFWDDNE